MDRCSEIEQPGTRAGTWELRVPYEKKLCNHFKINQFPVFVCQSVCIQLQREKPGGGSKARISVRWRWLRVAHFSVFRLHSALCNTKNLDWHLYFFVENFQLGACTSRYFRIHLILFANYICYRKFGIGKKRNQLFLFVV